MANFVHELTVEVRAMSISKESYWGIGLMLVGVALGVFATKILGAICGLAGFAIIIWAQLRKSGPTPNGSDNRPDFVVADNRPDFVLEVGGSQPLDGTSDWRFFLTNGNGNRAFRRVELGPIKSEIGAYLLAFQEIPIITPHEKLTVPYEVVCRRECDIHEGKKATLWDFARDHAGERGHTFIWYDIPVRFHERDDLIRDAGIVSFHFDLDRKIISTAGLHYWEMQKENARMLENMKRNIDESKRESR